MSRIDAFLSWFAPHVCLGCKKEGRLLCHRCIQNLSPIPSRCYRCHRLTPDARTCPSCKKRSSLYAVHVATIYEGVAKDIVWKLKYAGTQTAAREIAGYMFMHVPALPADVLVVPAPTATLRVRRRGYDQAVLIAHAFARAARRPVRVCLARQGQAHQVGANRRQRLTQLSSAFRVTDPRAVQNAHIILVDDVITTGATLESAAKALMAAGARRVEALVFAQP